MFTAVGRCWKKCWRLIEAEKDEARAAAAELKISPVLALQAARL